MPERFHRQTPETLSGFLSLSGDSSYEPTADNLGFEKRERRAQTRINSYTCGSKRHGLGGNKRRSPVHIGMMFPRQCAFNVTTCFLQPNRVFPCSPVGIRPRFFPAMPQLSPYLHLPRPRASGIPIAHPAISSVSFYYFPSPAHCNRLPCHRPTHGDAIRIHRERVTFGRKT